MNPKDDLNSDLDNFRQQWITDLRSREDTAGQPSHSRPPPPRQAVPAAPGRQPGPPPSGSKKPAPTHDDDDYLQGRTFGEHPAPSPSHPTLNSPPRAPKKELVSALDHYEEAMEKEVSGNMGDSLRLYRKAYRVRLCRR